MKYAYVSGITNDSFLKGVLVMFASIKQHSMMSNVEYVCFVTDAVSETARRKLINNGIKLYIPKPVNCSASGRWETTFQKICIFDMTDFDKIVWVDADMLILKSLDELFTHKHMSCVRSRAKMRGTDVYSFNSGIMVIEPSNVDYLGICTKIQPIIDEYAQSKLPVGDQNVLNAFFSGWPYDEDCHLDDGYNVFWGSIEDYLDNGYSNLSGKPIYVLHYTGSHKPWKRSTSFWIKTYIRSIRYHHHFTSQEARKYITQYKQYMRLFV